jgi:hypothetical protein
MVASTTRTGTSPAALLTRWVAAAVTTVVAFAPGEPNHAAAPPSEPASPLVAADVRPFAEVQASEMTFEPDPTDPSRVIFRVTTSEPMICAIVWGETPAFGRFNNSLAMSGTGIVQHDVVLPEVEPGRTYFYRVQGSTADGVLYSSPTDSFRVQQTFAAATSPAHGLDVIEGVTIAGVSSEFGADFTAANALDGDVATEWSSADEGDGAWITVDLGTQREIAAVEFVTRSMADGSAITSTFTVTVDDAVVLGPFEASTAAAPRVAALATFGRLLRFEVVSSTGGNVGASEIRVYGN